MTKSSATFAAAILVASSLAACSSAPPPNASPRSAVNSVAPLALQRAQQSLTQVQTEWRNGADQRAEHNAAIVFTPLQLQAAHDKLAAAQQAVRDHNNVLATSLATESRAETKFAQVNMEAGHAEETAVAVQQTTGTFHNSANQTANSQNPPL